MMRKLFLLILFLSCALPAITQDVYKSNSRLSYYTNEELVELVVWVPESKQNLRITIDIVFEFDFMLQSADVRAGEMNFFELPIDSFHMGRNELTVSYNENAKWVSSDKVAVYVYQDKYNAVKIDRLSGGLIVEELPFIPFGFYAYSPVQSSLAEEEVVKGFNMISPYQKIEGKTLKERKRYMDRCASLGMKVNYNLLSLAGGGGVGHRDQEKLSHRKRIKMLTKEIETFRDHPALLSWYISDEPVGQGVPADSLVESYELIKKLDPYHPIAVVFMSPWMAGNYSHVMDIVMADPYPIPHGKVSEVGEVADMLTEKFFLEKPVWIVPQAFGGNEWWEREPTPQELRAMTYLGLVNNAMGIQYFIRHGLNAFPKSTIAWNECGAIALEVAELTPYLFSAESKPRIFCNRENIQLRAFRKDGNIAVVAVNELNEPMNFNFNIASLAWTGKAFLPFENREVEVINGQVDDIIDGYGSRTYIIPYEAIRQSASFHTENILRDPGFENTAGTGVPASCYARPLGDRGATYFVDSRTAFEGDHSLRITTPVRDGGIALSFMRVNAKAKRSYTMRVKAKALPLKYRDSGKKSLWKKLCGCGPGKDDYPMFTMTLGGIEESFIPDGEWREYSFSGIPISKTTMKPLSPGLQLDDKGTAWFDMLELYPDMYISSSVETGNNKVSICLGTNHEGADIYYTTDESEPGEQAMLYTGMFDIQESCIVKASAYLDNKQLGYIEDVFMISMATACEVEYENKWSPKYHAAYENALVDGILASPGFKDGKWQGFEGEDLDVVIDLGKKQQVQTVKLRFLSNRSSWIFLPTAIDIYWSEDGKEFFEYKTIKTFGAVFYPEPYRQKHILHNENVYAKYIRIVAHNIGLCPEGHPGEGGKAWLFTDEIVISDKKLTH